MTDEKKCASCDDATCEQREGECAKEDQATAERRILRSRMGAIKHKLIVLSGKGGGSTSLGGGMGGPVPAWETRGIAAAGAPARIAAIPAEPPLEDTQARIGVGPKRPPRSSGEGRRTPAQRDQPFDEGAQPGVPCGGVPFHGPAVVGILAKELRCRKRGLLVGFGHDDLFHQRLDVPS